MEALFEIHGELRNALGTILTCVHSQHRHQPGAHTISDYNRFLQGTYSTVFSAPAGFNIAAIQTPEFGSRASGCISPRLGLAWDVRGDGRRRFALHTYGYAFVSGDWREDTAGSNPWGGRVSISNPPGGLDAHGKAFPAQSLPVYIRHAPFLLRGQFKSTPT
jgi:hypothetical protein